MGAFSGLVDALAVDLREGARLLRRDLWATAAGVLILSVGIGAHAATISFLRRVALVAPPGLDRPDRLVAVESSRSYVEYQRLAAAARAVDLAAYTRNDVNVDTGARAWTVHAECVSGGYFDLLGVRPYLGRALTPSDATAAVPRVVLSYSLWRSRFGGEMTSLERTFDINGKQYSIVGVAPRGFRGVETLSADLWLPLEAVPEACSFTGTDLLHARAAWLTTIGRIRDPYSLAQAQADIDSLRSDDAWNPRGDARAALRPVVDAARRASTRTGRLAQWLVGGSSIALILVCANVAGLSMIRAVRRIPESRIRLQVGAPAWRLAGQSLIEAGLQALLAIPTSILVAVWIQTLLQAFFPRVVDAVPSVGPLAGTVALSAAGAALLTMALPVASLTRLMNAIGRERPGGSQVAPRSAGRHILLALQMALALTLAACAGMFVRSVSAAMRDIGFDLDRVAVVRLDLRRLGYARDAEIDDIMSRLLRRAKESPLVQSASLSSAPLLQTGGVGRAVILPASAGRHAVVMFDAVSDSYFATIGTRVIEGRGFHQADTAAAAPVTVLSQSAAAKLWPSEPSLGKCVTVALAACATVVGITESRRYGTLASVTDEIFVPLSQSRFYFPEILPKILLVRTVASAATVTPMLAASLSDVWPPLRRVGVTPMTELASEETRAWRSGASLFGLFSLVAIVLAAVGLYASLAMAVRARRQEIGVRIALGARPRDVTKLLAASVLASAVPGVLLGIAATAGASRIIANMLFQAPPTDWTAIGFAALMVLSAAFVGAVVPTRRATVTDPAVTLREI